MLAKTFVNHCQKGAPQQAHCLLLRSDKWTLKGFSDERFPTQIIKGHSLTHPKLTAICDALHSNLLSPKTNACTCTKHQNVKYVLNLHCKHIHYTVGEIVYNADMEDKGSVDVKIFQLQEMLQ